MFVVYYNLHQLIRAKQHFNYVNSVVIGDVYQAMN